jgi:hypothetical protein
MTTGQNTRMQFNCQQKHWLTGFQTILFNSECKAETRDGFTRWNRYIMEWANEVEEWGMNNVSMITLCR